MPAMSLAIANSIVFSSSINRNLLLLQLIEEQKKKKKKNLPKNKTK
tara:strand:- start:632 stop:769 length:138 start_codon:yes stop_codon:yes gene_type:complete